MLITEKPRYCHSITLDMFQHRVQAHADDTWVTHQSQQRNMHLDI